MNIICNSTLMCQACHDIVCKCLLGYWIFKGDDKVFHLLQFWRIGSLSKISLSKLPWNVKWSLRPSKDGNQQGAGGQAVLATLLEF